MSTLPATLRPKRNDPCLCGSGRKFKKCCIDKTSANANAIANGGAANDDFVLDDELTRAQALHSLDHELAGRIVRYCQRSFRDWKEPRFELDHQNAMAMVPWLVYEHCDDGDGDRGGGGGGGERCSMGTYFRLRNARRLTARELAWLDVQLATRLGVWRVMAVERGRSIRLQNVISGDDHVVIERMASKTLAVHEFVLARVTVFDGIAIANCMHPRTLNPREGYGLAEALRIDLGIHADVNLPASALAEKMKKGKGRTKTPQSLLEIAGRELDQEEQDRLAAHLVEHPTFGGMLITLWEGLIANRLNAPLPKLMTTDGEELTPIEDTFDIVGIDDDDHKLIRDRVRDALLALPYATLESEGDVDGDEDGEDGEAHPHPHVHVRGGGTRIVFIRPNPPGSALENTVLGTAEITQRHLVMQTHSRERAASFREQIQRACGALVQFASREETNPAELVERIQEQSDQHKLRTELELALREIEQHESRLHPSEQIDLGHLRKELGLESA